MRFYIRRIALNRGGYDGSNNYWGTGEPLWYFESENGRIDGYIRAESREEVKEKILQDHPGARFFR